MSATFWNRRRKERRKAIEEKADVKEQEEADIKEPEEVKEIKKKVVKNDTGGTK